MKGQVNVHLAFLLLFDTVVRIVSSFHCRTYPFKLGYFELHKYLNGVILYW